MGLQKLNSSYNEGYYYEIGLEEDGGFHAASDVLFILAAVLIILVNAYIAILISSRRDLRTASNLLLVSLAISDEFTGLVSVPLLLTCSIRPTLNGVCIASAVSLKFLSILSAMHILLITVDRYLFIVYAHKYYDMVRKSRVCVILLLVWLLSAVVSLVRLHWAIDMNVFDSAEVNLEKELEEDRKEKFFNWFCLIVFFCTPLLCTVILDAELLRVLRKQIRKILQDNLIYIRKDQIVKTKNRERRAVLVYVVVVSTFVICWLPYFIYELWQYWGSLPVAVEYIILNVRFLTSLSNPIMYTLSQRTLRRAVLISLRKRFYATKRKRTSDEMIMGYTTQINRTDTSQF